MEEYVPDDYYLQYARRREADRQAELDDAERECAEAKGERIPDFDSYLQWAAQEESRKEAAHQVEHDAVRRREEEMRLESQRKAELLIETKQALTREAAEIATLAVSAKIPLNVSTGFFAPLLKGWFLYEDRFDPSYGPYIDTPYSDSMARTTYRTNILTPYGTLISEKKASKKSTESRLVAGGHVYHIGRTVEYHEVHVSAQNNYERCRRSLARFAFENCLARPVE